MPNVGSGYDATSPVRTVHAALSITSGRIQSPRSPARLRALRRRRFSSGVDRRAREHRIRRTYRIRRRGIGTPEVRVVAEVDGARLPAGVVRRQIAVLGPQRWTPASGDHRRGLFIATAAQSRCRRVGGQSLGVGEQPGGSGKCRRGSLVQLLPCAEAQEVLDGEAGPCACPSGSRQHVVRARRVITECDRGERSEEDRARVAQSRQGARGSRVSTSRCSGAYRLANAIASSDCLRQCAIRCERALDDLAARLKGQTYEESLRT